MAAHVPAGVVAQVWRGSPKQHAIMRLLQAKAIRIHPMSDAVAFRIGLLLASTRSADVIDGHVALLGRSLGAVVLTSDPDDLRRLDAKLDIVVV